MSAVSRQIGRGRRRAAFFLVIAGVSAAAGCDQLRLKPATVAESSAAEIVQLYGPRKIEVLPFTKPKSFDEDRIPDGIEVSLRPLDGMGDPVKAYGTFQFELFVYRDATGNRAGERLEMWTQPILSADDQKLFWDRVTSTYMFQLTWEGGEFPPPGRKYLLNVTFQTPGGERLFAEYPFEFRLDREAIREGFSQAER